MSRLAALCAALLFLFATPMAALPAMAEADYAICQNQTYALCASASAFVYDDVSYAKCIIKKGDSISAPPLSFTTRSGKTADVCDVNAAGVRNGYMVSTFSLPLEVRQGGNRALYTCPGSSTGSYAQCDGGFCFKSSTGHFFPGVGYVATNQIICSCPITKPAASFQFIGPYPCQQQAFSACDQQADNGAIIPVGSPPGAGRVLTQALYGHQFPINECGSN